MRRARYIRDSDELRELGLITLKKQTLTILNCKMLQAYAEFDPVYTLACPGGLSNASY